VDGKPADLLRCNFIVRGVFLAPGRGHRVEFRYQPPLIGPYISLASVLVASSLLGFVWLGRKAPPPVSNHERQELARFPQ
jgi:hypothetical protein